jgi:cation:H+ antiporter
MFELTGLPLALNIGLFVACSAIVWAAGTRIAAYVGEIGDRTAMGQAFAGLLLLGGATSLPELANAATASAGGNAALAVNSLLGSVSMNVVLLALADAVLGRDALTSVVARPTTLFQGTLDVILLALVLMGIAAGEQAVLGVGLWSLSVLPAFAAMLWLSSRYEDSEAWTASPADAAAEPAASAKEQRGGKAEGLRSAIVKAAVAAAVILVTGFFLSKSGEAIAEQTGLRSGVVGFLLLGLATSLPEISSMVAAVRQRRYELAIGDVFGTNMFDLALIPVADVFFRGGAILSEAGRFEMVAALLGIILTCVYIIGLLERENRTVLRMGYDSVAALAIYSVGLAILFTLEDG